LIWGILSDERTGLSLIIAAIFTTAVILRSKSCRAYKDSPNLEDQIPVFISQEQSGPVITLGTGLTLGEPVIMTAI
jgi:hypothetical protein